MSKWAIVAIPSDEDYSWKISSEKVPHMTLLYLGEQNDPILALRILEYVEHASSNLDRFHMSVSHRGELGADAADVLFLEESWSTKIRELRANLLRDTAVKMAYESVEQHPKWTPHLTLGYPESPAKPYPKDRDWPISQVYFDRIAFWVEDYDGPSFMLGLSEESSALAISDISSDELAHYGVKGMRWGQRMAQRRSDKKAAAKKNSSEAAAKGYTSGPRNRDTAAVGYVGVKRIEKRIAKGEKISSARTKEYVTQLGAGLAVAGVGIATLYGPMIVSNIAKNVAFKKTMAQGAKAAADLFSDNRGLTSYRTLGLAFDSVTGSWG